jgi:hypothetical protein
MRSRGRSDEFEGVISNEADSAYHARDPTTSFKLLACSD